MNEITCPIADLSAEHFLEEYWQKKPLVIRQAFPNFTSPITPEELAGLSCETDVNSRIVIEKDGDHPWQPIYGPMDDEIFGRLPESHWTLLVNDVEKHLPELAWIVDQFRFIPEWRIDDLMISYAPVGGSVGPHMDLYDVFILQAEGHRRWQISTQAVSQDNQVEGTPLRIQKDFNAEHEWLLAPGDIIYIPPGVSHFGVATDDCLSYSIGFQAASFSDLISDYIAYITERLDTSQVYRDSDLQIQLHPNEITEDAITRVEEIFRRHIKPDRAEIRRWFGRYVSDTRTDIRSEPEQKLSRFEELLFLAEQGSAIFYRNPASRFAFITENNHALLYIDGTEAKVGINFAQALCHNRELNIKNLSGPDYKTDREVLVNLYNSGKIILTNDHSE